MRRREFVQVTGLATAGLLIGGRRKAYAFNQSPYIRLFGTPLRGVGPGGNIPVALPAPGAKAPITGVTRYNLQIKQFQDQIVPASSGLGPTTLWGYVPTNGLGDLKPDGSMVPRHLGGVMIGQRGVPIQINFRNLLSGAAQSQHIIPVDTTIPGANQAPNRTAVHLHGGLVPWISDGGPFDWFNFSGLHGSSFLNNQVLNPKAPANSAEYYYGMDQSARFLWYHDHAIGITRLNAYAGIASGLLLRDSFEANLQNQGLPGFIEAGGNELPLVIQEKVFVGPDIQSVDPTWFDINLQKVTRNPGSLWYAHVYDPERWDVGEGGLALPNPSAIPEFFGDTMLVNGTTYPQVTVQARRYRLRLLNATNARFLNLQLYVADDSPNGITLDASGFPTNAAFVNAATGDASWLQIGTEGGFLANPAKVPSNVPLTFQVPPDDETGTDPSKINKSLLVAPAERPDVIVDFNGYEGKSIILYADAPAPFPGGGAETDFFPGLDNDNPVNANTPNGFGPNSRVLMRFNVVPATGAADPPLNINTSTDLTPGLDPFLVPLALQQAGGPLPPVDNTRTLSLYEYFDEYGRLIQILGNDAAPYGSPYEGTATYLDHPAGTQEATQENVNAGATEVWEIFNMTGDVHPMHFHLVNVQVINRQLFDMSAFPGFKVFTGPEIPPDDNELGWKETVPMYPGTVTRVIMKFDVPEILTATGQVVPTPVSPRTGGNEYVWHCHILEHEEHDMMHALVVT